MRLHLFLFIGWESNMKCFVWVLCIVVLVVANGCLPLIGGGVAGIREFTDKAVTYRGSIEQVEIACRKALKERGGVVKKVSREEKQGGNRTIRGKTYDGDPITIDMEPISPNEVEIEVRIGRIGSKTRAEVFHATLMKYIKAVL